MSIRLITIVALIVTCACEAFAAGRRPEAQANAIQDFAFEQITFKTTIGEFKKAYRGAISTPKSNVGESHFAIYPEKVHQVGVDFLDERLLEISLIYSDEQLKGLGDAAGMKTRLIERFGAPDRDKDGIAAWESGGKRIVASVGKDGGYVICILDNGLDVELQNRKRKLDAGF